MWWTSQVLKLELVTSVHIFVSQNKFLACESCKIEILGLVVKKNPAFGFHAIVLDHQDEYISGCHTKDVCKTSPRT